MVGFVYSWPDGHLELVGLSKLRSSDLLARCGVLGVVVHCFQTVLRPENGLADLDLVQVVQNQSILPDGCVFSCGSGARRIVGSDGACLNWSSPRTEAEKSGRAALRGMARCSTSKASTSCRTGDPRSRHWAPDASRHRNGWEHPHKHGGDETHPPFPHTWDD